MISKREQRLRAAYTRGFNQEAKARGVKDAYASCPFHVLDDPGVGVQEAFTLGQADASSLKRAAS